MSARSPTLRYEAFALISFQMIRPNEPDSAELLRTEHRAKARDAICIWDCFTNLYARTSSLAIFDTAAEQPRHLKAFFRLQLPGLCGDVIEPPMGLASHCEVTSAISTILQKVSLLVLQ